MHTGQQWEVDQHVFRTRLGHLNYDFATSRMGEIEDWGFGPIYTFPVHLAEKDWVDIEDFIVVFTYAWLVYGALQSAPLDRVVLERSLQRARKVSARGY